MKVSGFTFVRNAIKYDYPVVESINSLLPLVDELVVAVGNSEDGTRELIESIDSPRIRIIDTVWDDTKRTGGGVLAEETNKAFDAISSESTWAFYIQADEVIHQDDHQTIRNAMDLYAPHKEIDGIVFRYLHFYGSYDFIGASRNWYRREARIIRNDKKIRSYRDAQGFRRDGRPLLAGEVPATIYHYGWVKPPELQKAKLGYFHKLWHDEEWMARKAKEINEFDYSDIDFLARFEGTHPQVMKDRISRKNWHFDFDPSKKKLSFGKRLLHAFERKSGIRFGEFRNYRISKNIIFKSPTAPKL